MNLDPFGDGGTDRHARVERAVGVLEDDLHPPAESAEGGSIERENVSALEDGASAGGLLQPQDRAPDRRLAATRFSHQRQGLGPANLEGHSIHRTYGRSRASEQAGGLIVLLQISYREQRCARISHLAQPASNACDDPSPRGAAGAPAHSCRRPWGSGAGSDSRWARLMVPAHSPVLGSAAGVVR